MVHTGNEPNALSCQFKSSASWIIDSGVSDHMNNSSNLFESYTPCPGNKKFRIADGNSPPIAGKCEIKITKRMHLKFVLMFLSFHILFCQSVSYPKILIVIFYDSHCVVQDRSSRTMIGNARMINGLYYFEDNLLINKIAQGISGFSSVPIHDQITIWHYRLSHPSFLI